MMHEPRPGAACPRRWGGPAGRVACTPALSRDAGPSSACSHPAAAVRLNQFGSSESWKLVPGGVFEKDKQGKKNPKPNPKRTLKSVKLTSKPSVL